MKLATATGDFAGYGLSVEECVKLVHDAGFKYVDFSMGGQRFFSNDNWKEEVLKLRDYAESLGMTFVQAHSPDGKIWNPEDAERYVKLATRAVEICEILGIPQVVVHAGYQKGVSIDEFYEKNQEFYKRLFTIM